MQNKNQTGNYIYILKNPNLIKFNLFEDYKP